MNGFMSLIGNTKYLLAVLTTSILSSCGSEAVTISEEEMKLFKEMVLEEMVFVEGGSFMMGDVGHTVIENGRERWYPYTGETDDDHVHKVTLDSFYMDKYETTRRRMFVHLVDTGVELEESRFIYKQPYPSSQNDRRKRSIAFWHEAKDFCLWQGKLIGKKGRLPTEAEWEYAARSRGKNVRFATDNGHFDYSRNTESESPMVMKSEFMIGKYPPNPLGLHDMSGGGGEWVQDWYSVDYYAKSLEHNPKGPDRGTKKGVRGASYSEHDRQVVNRFGRPPRGGATVRCVYID